MQQQSTSLCDTKYKIVFLGSMGVGKTSIIERFVKDYFDTSNNPTVGIDFLTKNISFLNKTYRLQLWDTAGQQKYKSLVPAYLRDANCAVFVFDFLKKQTLDDLKNWIQLYREYGAYNSIAFLLANKCDAFDDPQILSEIEDKQNIVKLQEDAIQFARKQGIILRKVSAKTGKNVINTFQDIVLELQKDKEEIQNQNEDQNDPQTRFENYVLQKMDKLRIEDIKQGKRNLSCCYI